MQSIFSQILIPRVKKSDRVTFWQFAVLWLQLWSSHLGCKTLNKSRNVNADVELTERKDSFLSSTFLWIVSACEKKMIEEHLHVFVMFFQNTELHGHCFWFPKWDFVHKVHAFSANELNRFLAKRPPYQFFSYDF